jgi:ubiquinone/menaquinone biosynthesis C-methylase UbiE
MPAADSPTRELLERAARLVRLPGAPDMTPEVDTDLPGLRFAHGGRAVPLRAGVLDLLGDDFAPTVAQKAFDMPLSAGIYDRLRNLLAPRIGMPRFSEEVAEVTERLALGPADVVLDVACGHGNFTVELARRVGPGGLVVGVDISWAMLARAAARVARDRLTNVLLVRGDALALPIADASLAKLNCSGGLHQLPDLARALAEIARVSAPGARVVLSSFASGSDQPARWRQLLRDRFALHVVSLPALVRDLEALGFTDAGWRMSGPLFGRAWAQRPA